jgi:hypothetical protein
VLQSASRVSSIKKVVITASVASLVPLDKYANGLIVTGKHQTQPSLECPLTFDREHRKGGA